MTNQRIRVITAIVCMLSLSTAHTYSFDLKVDLNNNDKIAIGVGALFFLPLVCDTVRGIRYTTEYTRLKIAIDEGACDAVTLGKFEEIKDKIQGLKWAKKSSKALATAGVAVASILIALDKLAPSGWLIMPWPTPTPPAATPTLSQVPQQAFASTPDLEIRHTYKWLTTPFTNNTQASQPASASAPAAEWEMINWK